MRQKLNSVICFGILATFLLGACETKTTAIKILNTYGNSQTPDSNQTQPSPSSKPSTRPNTKPSTSPSTRPSSSPSTKPSSNPSQTYTCSDYACIQSKLSEAHPGDTIKIAPGDYLGDKANTIFEFYAYFRSDRSGSADAPITLEALDPNNKPVLHGKNPGSAYILHLYNARYWVIKDIVFHSASKGLILDNVQNSILDGVEVYNVGLEAVHFRDGSSNNIIRNSYIHDTGVNNAGYGEGVYIGSADGTDRPDGTEYNRDAENILVSNVTFGPNVAAEHIDIKERTSGAIIENCTFNAAGLQNGNSTDSVVNAKGNNAIIRNNVINRQGNSNLKFAFKIFSVRQAGLLSGYGNKFIDNVLNLDDAEPYVISIESRMTAYVKNNTRIPTQGNLYTGTGKAVEIAP